MIPAGGITQGTFGYCMVNGTVILIRPGASQDFPLNFDIPAPINGYGGYGAMNIEEGLQFPSWNVPCVPLDTGGINWFSTTNLNAFFMTRSARPVWDLPAFSTFVYSENGSVGDGQGVWNGIGTKGAGFTLTGRKGQGIAMMMRFAGVNAIPITSAAALPATGLAGRPLSFNRIISLGTAFETKGAIGFTLQFDTGLTPNMELDGTLRPVEQNAGTPNCSLSVEFNALNAIHPPGWNPSTNTRVELNDQTIIINVVDGPSPQNITFTLKRLHIRDPRNRRGTAGRAQRTHAYECLATTTAQPLVIA